MSTKTPLEIAYTILTRYADLDYNDPTLRVEIMLLARAICDADEAADQIDLLMETEAEKRRSYDPQTRQAYRPDREEALGEALDIIGRAIRRRGVGQ